MFSGNINAVRALLDSTPGQINKQIVNFTVESLLYIHSVFGCSPFRSDSGKATVSQVMLCHTTFQHPFYVVRV